VFVSLEASIRECKVNSSLLECPASGIHSVSDSVDVHNIDFVHVQSYGLRNLFYFGAQIEQVRTSKFT